MPLSATTDPLETRDLAGSAEHAGAVEQLRKLLIDELASSRTVRRASWTGDGWYPAAKP
jgi:hypothetical protein